MEININGQGNMTKMATMAINSKPFINLILQNRKNYDFDTLSEASVNGALQSLYNHDPLDDLDLFYGKVSCQISQITGERLQDYWSSGSDFVFHS